MTNHSLSLLRLYLQQYVPTTATFSGGYGRILFPFEAMPIDQALKKDEKGFERIQVFEAVGRWRIKVILVGGEDNLSKLMKKERWRKTVKNKKTVKKDVKTNYHMHCSCALISI